jgi:hypothetical protein
MCDIIIVSWREEEAMGRTERAVITRTGSKGQAVEIGVVIDGSAAWVYAKVDGKTDATVLGPGRLSKPQMHEGRIYTHHIGHVGILADELPLIESALAEANREASQTPAGLREQRLTLVAAIAGALDETEAARERGYNEDIGRIPSYDSPEYRAAKQALAEFDATHPEVKAALEQERQESIKRHMWD